MGKKARRREKPAKHEGAQRSPAARNAAPSSSWPDMPYSAGPTRGKLTVSVKRRQPIAGKHPRQGRPATLQSLFGTWQLPTPPRPQSKASEAVSTCVARHQRREVLFATRQTGAGATAPRKKFTNRSCK